MIFAIFCSIGIASAQLKVGFYNSSCSRAESIIRGVVQQRFNRDRSITAALLRMHFHDCFVRVIILLFLEHCALTALSCRKFYVCPTRVSKILKRAYTIS